MKARLERLALVTAGLVSGGLLLACPATLDDRCSDGACALRADIDGGAPEPAGCTYGLGPTESPACVTDAYAVFVAPTGADTADGTKAAPLRTIDAAVGRAVATGKPHVYVCTGEYQSSVSISRRLGVFGIACDFVSPAGSDRPRWTGASPEFVARITSVAQRVVLADLAIVAQDAPADADGQSSIGLLVADSADVQLVRADVKAGRGSNGKNASSKAQLPVAEKGKAGADRPDSAGGAGGLSTCTDGESLGGTGGSAFGVAAQPGLPQLDGGAGGVPINPLPSPACTGSALGQPGASGSPGADAPAPTALGALTSAGWRPASGAKGRDGTRAQGGGGGAAYGAAGGGGGAGGCGGDGGGGGSGGGASIALLAVASSVTIIESTLSGGQAGNGGAGAAGQPGQPGGFNGGGGRAFVSSTSPDGCPGGNGGEGGNGGAGAGGAAGIARAILFKGSRIDKESATLAAGTSGRAGDGGKPTNGGPAAEGMDQQEL